MKYFALWLISISSFVAINNTASGANSLSAICPEPNLETLTTRLLQDLPAYANRATQRARRRRTNDPYSYMIVAGKPDFTTPPYEVHTGVEEFFFTTLERQYLNGEAYDYQQFHRLLLTKTTTGWRLVMMFSQTGEYPQERVPSPPRDSSYGAIAQGIRTWLRDCGAIR